MSVCVLFILFIHGISIRILCVSREEFSFTESNQQIWDFNKLVIFEKQRHCRTLQSKFLISANYSSSVLQTTTVSMQQLVLIYMHMGV